MEGQGHIPLGEGFGGGDHGIQRDFIIQEEDLDIIGIIVVVDLINTRWLTIEGGGSLDVVVAFVDLIKQCEDIVDRQDLRQNSVMLKQLDISQHLLEQQGSSDLIISPWGQVFGNEMDHESQ